MGTLLRRWGSVALLAIYGGVRDISITVFFLFYEKGDVYMDIDSLQIKISSDSSKATRAINNLIEGLSRLNSSLANYGPNSSYINGIANLSQAFNNLSEAISRIDTDKLNNVSASVKGIGKSFKSLNASINEVDFTKLESAGKATSRTLEKEISELVKSFGIEGDAAQRVSESLREYYKAFTQKGDAGSANFFKNAVKEITNAEIKLHQLSDTYTDVIDYIKSTNSSGNKVYLPFDPSEFIDDYTSMRATLGKAFTSDKAFSGAQDIAEYIAEMNATIGTSIDITQTEADMFRELVSILRSSKDDISDFSKNVQTITVSEDDAQKAVADFISTMYLYNKTIEEGGSANLNYENSIETIVSDLNKLNGLNIPDMSSLDALTSSIRKLGGVKVDNAIKNIPALSESLRDFIDGVNSAGAVNFNVESLTNMISSISKLGSKKVTSAVKNLPELGYYLSDFVQSMNNIGKVSFETSGLSDLTQTIRVLGGKSVTNAISNLPQLTKALTDFIQTLSTMPNVSQNIIDTVNALANLASQGQKVGSSMKGLSNAFNRSQGSTKRLGNGFKRLSHSGKGLAAMFGKIYASYFLLFRAFGKFRESIKLSADLTEVQNVVNKSFGNMASDVEDFAKTSIETFGMSELSAKKFASTFQAMGNAMGITNKQVQASNASWKDVSGLYDNAADSVADMSINLTKLAADMGSFFNQENEQVAERLASGIYSGQARALMFSAYTQKCA